MTSQNYDILVVGAGVAGCGIAHALSSHPSNPRIALLERSLATPSRIVGELLQPSGFQSLASLGMLRSVEEIEAAQVHGYYVWDGEQRTGVQIPYTGKNEGRSFHHGRFIDGLRKCVETQAKNVDMIECTASKLVYENGRVVGVQVKTGPEKVESTYHAPLTIVADGCFSIFRASLLAPELLTKSHFVGTILKNASLPLKYHGTVGLIPKGNGPCLLYQIQDSANGETETRLLVDVKAPMPRDLKAHIKSNIVPHLPEALHEPVLSSLESADPEYRIRTMPNTFLPPAPQSASVPPGVFLLGDAYNMRHPLTGAGMSVALHDVVVLRDLFNSQTGTQKPWEDDATMSDILAQWYWRRKSVVSSLNILSVALYDLFGADDINLAILRNGCFKYFERGGRCIDDPVNLLSGVAPSTTLLFRHFFTVAFYAIIVLFTRANPPTLYGDKRTSHVTAERRSHLWEYPGLMIRSVVVFLTAVKVFGPLLWTELRWWNPWPSPNSRTMRKTAGSTIVNAFWICSLAALLVGLIGSLVLYVQMGLHPTAVASVAGATVGSQLDGLKMWWYSITTSNSKWAPLS